MRYGGTLVLMVALVAGFALTANRLGYKTPTEAKAEQFAGHNTTAYTLPPGKLEKAVALNRIGLTPDVSREIWTVVRLLLILSLGAAARMRDIAVGLSRNRWVQGFSFAFL